ASAPRLSRMSLASTQSAPAAPLSLLRWSLPGRAIIFTLSAASIWCLLSEFYGLCSMRTFTVWILIPASVALIAIAIYDRIAGDRRLWRSVLIGMAAGFVAAVAYDIFRIPYVVAAATHAGPGWLRLPLYKVFPQFGAMILAQPFSPQQADSQFTLAAHVVGWAYHLSNGITFGVMYVALLGDPREKSWWWGVVMAVGIEVMLLLTPYTGFFGIGLTAEFVVATLAAHLIFGAVMGSTVRAWANIFAAPVRTTAPPFSPT
ncbi:MAG TPA: hypothetical protein VLI90_13345, partial [Tepidisphaeraceae bacterium]|nr:hypothetical protein [Tepidisphaeraceae bacterium]